MQQFAIGELVWIISPQFVRGLGEVISYIPDALRPYLVQILNGGPFTHGRDVYMYAWELEKLPQQP